MLYLPDHIPGRWNVYRSTDALFGVSVGAVTQRQALSNLLRARGTGGQDQVAFFAGGLAWYADPVQLGSYDVTYVGPRPGETLTLEVTQ